MRASSDCFANFVLEAFVEEFIRTLYAFVLVFVRVRIFMYCACACVHIACVFLCSCCTFVSHWCTTKAWYPLESVKLNTMALRWVHLGVKELRNSIRLHKGLAPVQAAAL